MPTHYFLFHEDVVTNPNAHAAVDDAATTAAVMSHLGASKLAKAIKKQGVPFDAGIVAS